MKTEILKKFKEFLQENVEHYGCTVFKYYDGAHVTVYVMAVRSKTENGDDFFSINGNIWYNYISEWENYKWKVLWRYDGSE